MPDGVTIIKVLPEQQTEEVVPRVFMLYPGGTVPPFGVVLQNRRNQVRLVQLDAITGVPQVSEPAT
jgi:hypothetical protein